MMLRQILRYAQDDSRDVGTVRGQYQEVSFGS
jgi:hypothetical protein